MKIGSLSERNRISDYMILEMPLNSQENLHMKPYTASRQATCARLPTTTVETELMGH